MAELYRYFNKRFGAAPLPDDDDGRDSLKLVFQVLSTTNDAARRMSSVAGTWAPWMPADELDAMVADVVANPRRFKADTIAVRLGITKEIRDELDLRTIGAIDETTEQRKERRRETQRLIAEQKRRERGALTRAQIRQRCTNRPLPWRDDGVDRSTWFRRKKRAALALEAAA